MTTALEFGARTALVVVDVQNDFARPGGKLTVPDGEEVIPVINELVEQATACGAFVVYTQDWHPEDTPHFETRGGRWPPHCVAGTSGAELHADLHVIGPVVRKGTGPEDGYSAFTAWNVATRDEIDTGLDTMLRDHDVEHVVVVGLAQDVCVTETAIDARSLGYDTTVLLDATRPVATDPVERDAALDRMRSAGAHLRWNITPTP
jgi:nicotinamidase/pyrazinamidase